MASAYREWTICRGPIAGPPSCLSPAGALDWAMAAFLFTATSSRTSLLIGR